MKLQLIRLIPLSALLAGTTLLAQAPAGRGGNATPTNASATPAQIEAVSALNDSLAALTAAVTTARNELTQASFAVPRNQADIDAKADALAQAELRLANERSNGLARIQSGANRLNDTQLTVLRGQAATAGGGRGGFTQSEPLDYGDMTGFVKIFDGTTLNGWDGAQDVWFVDDSAISAKGGVGTTYIVYKGARVRNFELKLEVKIDGANTGIQYRSRLTGGGRSGMGGNGPDRTPEQAAAQGGGGGRAGGGGFGGGGNFAAWDMGGYQFDLGGRNHGQLYEQDGRGIVVYPGEVGELLPGLTGPRHRIIGNIGDVSSVEKPNDWNTIHLIANGNTLIHISNGQLTSVSVDNDPNYFAADGWLGLQIEGGGQLWFRDIWLKQLPD